MYSKLNESLMKAIHKRNLEEILFKMTRLILNASITVVCFSRLLKCLRSFYGKQCGPRSDCSYSSRLEQSVLDPRCLLLYLIRQ